MTGFDIRPQIGRRTALAGGAALLLTGSRRVGAEAGFATAAIDVHHHYLPPFYKPLARPWLDCG